MRRCSSNEYLAYFLSFFSGAAAALCLSSASFAATPLGVPTFLGLPGPLLGFSGLLVA